MPRKLQEMIVQLDLSKDSDGEVKVKTSAHVLMGTTEYLDMDKREGIDVKDDAQIEAAAVNLAKMVVQYVLAKKKATDAIPVPPKPKPPPEPEPEPEEETE